MASEFRSLISLVSSSQTHLPFVRRSKRSPPRCREARSEVVLAASLLINWLVLSGCAPNRATSLPHSVLLPAHTRPESKMICRTILLPQHLTTGLVCELKGRLLLPELLAWQVINGN